MKKFTVSYELVTDESAEHGDAEDRGRISTTDLLRDAIDDLMGCGEAIIDVEPNDRKDPRWVTIYYDRNCYGEYESRDLYFRINEGPTLSTRKRIAKLLGAKI